MNQVSQLLEIATRVVYDPRVTEVEITLALSLINSESLEAQAAAVFVLLVSKSNRLPVFELLEKISWLTGQASEAAKELNDWLISIIARLPVDDILRNTSIRRFCYRSLFGHDKSPRCNVVLILGRLAEHEDGTSIKLLKLALDDEDITVRTNAHSCLEELDKL